MKTKIIGSLLGAAIGDGFGYPTEFMKYGEIIGKWGPKGLRAPIGEIIEITDDTQMAVAVSKAIMSSYEAADIKPIKFEKALRKEFIEWMNSAENNRAPGMTCMRSCENLELGLKWEAATAKNSKGCGANMRVNPVGLLKFKDKSITESQIGQWAQFQSAITHGHAVALAASELTALTTIKIINGVDPNYLVEELIAHCDSQASIYHIDYLGSVWERPGINTPEDYINRGWKDCKEILLKVKEAIKLQDRVSDPCDFTGEGWIAEEAFATALVCFLLYPDDAVETLIRAVNTRGDSDSIACLAGGFAGAKNGIDSFPETWRNRLELKYKIALEQYGAFILNDKKTI